MGALSTLLACVGLVLVFCEFFIPSGLFALVAAGAFIGSIVLFGQEGLGWEWTALYTFGLFIVYVGVSFFALWRVKKDISLKTDQTGYLASTFDETLIGREGIVLSDLRPSGHILIEEKQIQAFSETGYLSKGTLVVVVGGRGANLIVRRKK